MSIRAGDQGPIPYPPGVFEIQSTFRSMSSTSQPARPRRIAAIAKRVGCQILQRNTRGAGTLGIVVEIDLMPQEVADAVPFDRDFANCTYDAEYANRALANSGFQRQGAPRFRAKSWEMQSGSLLLGSFDWRAAVFRRLARRAKA